MPHICLVSQSPLHRMDFGVIELVSHVIPHFEALKKIIILKVLLAKGSVSNKIGFVYKICQEVVLQVFFQIGFVYQVVFIKEVDLFIKDSNVLVLT